MCGEVGRVAADDDYFDVQQLKQLIDLDGTGEALAELTMLLQRTGPEQVDAVALAADQGDPDGVRRAAHTLKGSAATFGARELTGLSSAIAEAARSGELPDKSTVEKLRLTLAATLERLNEQITRNQGAAPSR